MDTYAIIRLGNKQHKVRNGETLVVDRLHTDEGKSFEPDVLLGETKVTATVIAHERGPKIRIGKYRKRTGYKRHNGYRSATSRVQISLGGARAAAPAKKETTPKAVPAPAAPKAEAPKAEAPKAEAPKAEAPKAAAPKAANPPKGYEEMTVAEIKEGSETWRRPQLEAALAFEQKNAKRKGAIAALEAALEAKGEK
jgi:large subunit ribosomal protein L21